MSVKLGSDYPRLQVNELKAIARTHCYNKRINHGEPSVGI